MTLFDILSRAAGAMHLSGAPQCTQEAIFNSGTNLRGAGELPQNFWKLNLNLPQV